MRYWRLWKYFFAQDHKSIHPPSAYLSVAILERKNFDKSWLDPHLDLLQPLVKKGWSLLFNRSTNAHRSFARASKKDENDTIHHKISTAGTWVSITPSTLFLLLLMKAFYSKFESESDARPLDKQCPAIKWVLYNQQPSTRVALTQII